MLLKSSFFSMFWTQSFRRGAARRLLPACLPCCLPASLPASLASIAFTAPILFLKCSSSKSTVQSCLRERSSTNPVCQSADRPAGWSLRAATPRRSFRGAKHAAVRPPRHAAPSHSATRPVGQRVPTDRFNRDRSFGFTDSGRRRCLTFSVPVMIRSLSDVSDGGRRGGDGVGVGDHLTTFIILLISGLSNSLERQSFKTIAASLMSSLRSARLAQRYDHLWEQTAESRDPLKVSCNRVRIHGATRRGDCRCIVC